MVLKIWQSQTMFPLKDSLPTVTPPRTIWVLVVLNVSVFLYSYFFAGHGNSEFIRENCFRASFLLEQVRGDKILLSLFVSSFIHAGFSHLFFNMWALVLFGRKCEEKFGKFRILAVYFISSFIGMLLYGILHLNSCTPLVGASAGISGIIGAYFILYPRAKILTVLPSIYPIYFEIRSAYYVGFWFLYQLALSLYDFSGQSGHPLHIAFSAHVGGFLCGILLSWTLIGRSNQEEPAQVG